MSVRVTLVAAGLALLLWGRDGGVVKQGLWFVGTACLLLLGACSTDALRPIVADSQAEGDLNIDADVAVESLADTEPSTREPSTTEPAATRAPRPTPTPRGTTTPEDEPEDDPGTTKADLKADPKANGSVAVEIEASAVIAEPSQVAMSDQRCAHGRIRLTLPADWAHADCARFNLEGSPLTGEVPIDAATNNERYPDALARIESQAIFEVIEQTAESVAERAATLFTVNRTLPDGQVRRQHIAVVDLANDDGTVHGVYFLAATENAGATPDGLDPGRVLASFQAILNSASYQEPVVRAPQPESLALPADPGPGAIGGCPAPQNDPTVPLAVTGPTAVIDLNGDGRPEVVKGAWMNPSGLTYRLLAHDGDCAWDLVRFLIFRGSLGTPISFACRPDASGYLVVEQSRWGIGADGDEYEETIQRFDGTRLVRVGEITGIIGDSLHMGGHGGVFPQPAGDLPLCGAG